tara:strand:- start:83 stop:619 length:537 start_codon:yes stop_codon:yes gene_type:complete
MIGFIYKLSDNSDKVYYGSTIQPLNDRFSKHRYSDSCRSKIMDKDTMKIECLEEFNHHLDFILKKLLKKRECYYIRNFECINKNIPDRTRKEWRKDNKETIKLKQKEYYEKNKETIKLLQKEYLENHKEQINKYKREYREKNKERTKEKFTCECGSIVRIDCKLRHNRSKKHQAFISE